MRIFITGGAGFIGSHLVDKLLTEGGTVTVYDNFSTGRIENLANKNVTIIKGDMLDATKLRKALKEQNMVYHLAANPDVRIGSRTPETQFNDIVGTYNLLEAMRLMDVSNIVFTSSSVVYGEATVIPTPESYGPLIPISIYGAAKLSAESLISAYSETFGIKCWIYRLANIVGPRCTHGILFDFINKLKRNSAMLEVFGNGNQMKSYLYIDDCIKGMLLGVKKANRQVNIFNICNEDQLTVRKIAEIVIKKLNLKNVELNYTGGKKGWIGDVPVFLLSIDELKKLGWKPMLSSEEAIKRTLDTLIPPMTKRSG